jgi:hypothetical protein
MGSNDGAAEVLRAVDRDAAGEGVGLRTARLVFWLPVVGAFAVAAAAADTEAFLAVVGEDGPLEWLQFAGFLATSLLLAVASWRLARRGDVVAAVLIGVGALGMFGIAGEEISWGQRLLDLETPEALADANHQGELNLHNVTTFPMQRVGNYLQLLLGGFGLVMPWLTRVRRPVVTQRLLRLLSPPLFVTTGFGLLFAYRLVRFVWDNETRTVVKYGEWPELTFALGLAVAAFLLVRGLREAGGAGTEPDAGVAVPDGRQREGTTSG